MTALDPLADVLREAYRDWHGRLTPPESLPDTLARAAREHIAAEIEAAYVPSEVELYDHAAGLEQAARIARGGTP